MLQTLMPLRRIVLIDSIARTPFIMSLSVAPAWEAVSDTGHNIRL